MLAVGLVISIIACIVCDIVFLVSRSKLKNLIEWSSEGYEVEITENKMDFINYYNGSEMGKRFPAELYDDGVYIIGIKAAHRITWLGRKLYSDRAYIDEIVLPSPTILAPFRPANWDSAKCFPEQIEFVHEGICMMELVVKAFYPTHPIPKLATRNTYSFRHVETIGISVFWIGVLIMLIGIVRDVI